MTKLKGPRRKTRQTVKHLMYKYRRQRDVASQVVIEWHGGKHTIVTRPSARFFLMEHLRQKRLRAAEHPYPHIRQREYELIRKMFADLKKYYRKPRLP